MNTSQVKIMGIVNITPDSFYSGNRFMYVEDALNQIQKHIEEGADIIDLGAQSTRPNATMIDPDTEFKRLYPILNEVKNLPLSISIDTFYAQVAEKCLSIREVWINDISGGNIDSNMLPFVFHHKPTYIWTHSRGTPNTMQTLTDYHDVANEVYRAALNFITQANAHHFTRYIIDVGFGFAKTIKQNFELIQNFEKFQLLNAPLLVGVSRKSMVYKTLNTTPENALNGTTVLHTLLLLKGANILRVHDVRAAKEVIDILSQI
ncbi:MAG: dihydropteroate synthase [Bacteroidia bacterium]|nr:dihydropteroate synthase [Bacteroidia bacterium]MDW8347612.1 dihydropteroate synthase [Bacteroidia bacterium]